MRLQIVVGERKYRQPHVRIRGTRKWMQITQTAKDFLNIVGASKAYEVSTTKMAGAARASSAGNYGVYRQYKHGGMVFLMCLKEMRRVFGSIPRVLYVRRERYRRFPTG